MSDERRHETFFLGLEGIVMIDQPDFYSPEPNDPFEGMKALAWILACAALFGGALFIVGFFGTLRGHP